MINKWKLIFGGLMTFSCLKYLFLVLFFFFTQDLNSVQYKLFDLGKLLSEPESYATGINDSGQVVGIICPNRMWFAWDNNGINKLQIYQTSSTLGVGCAPYLNNLGIVSEIFINSNSQYLSIENNKLFLCSSDGKILIDDDCDWIKPENGFYIRINNNLEIAGIIRGDNDKNQVKYINVKSNIKKILPIKYSCTVTGINDLGDVIGWFHAQDGLIQSFLWQPSLDNWQVIKNFRAASINNNRIIVGTYQSLPGVPPQGALWENGVISILDNLLNLSNDMTIELETVEIVNSINNNNEMVGWGRTGGPRNASQAVLIKRLFDKPVQHMEQYPVTLVINPAYEQKEYERLSLECSRIAEQFTAMGTSKSSAFHSAIVQYLKKIGTPIAQRVLKDQVAAGRIPAYYLKKN